MRRLTRFRTDETGAVTAELAVGFPVVVMLLVVVLTLAAASGAQLRALDAARAGARAVAIGQTDPQIAQVVAQVAGTGASVEVTRQADWVSVRVAKPVLTGWFTRVPLRAHGEAYAWFEPG